MPEPTGDADAYFTQINNYLQQVVKDVFYFMVIFAILAIVCCIYKNVKPKIEKRRQIKQEICDNTKEILMQSL